MRIYVQWLVSVSILLSTVFLLGSCKSTPSSNLKDDREALLALKSCITNDPSGALSSWGNNGSSACTWTGIICNHAGRVLELDIGGLNLSGRISPHIGNLSALISLKLQNNHFEGNIPDQLGKLDRLQTLDLSSNILSGTVPLPLYNISALVFLAFPGNDLYGEIPSDLGYHLPNLRTLNICFNRFHGSIPSSLHNLTKIETIRMSYNLLIGSVPPGLSGLDDLVTYNIQGNQISDTTKIISDLTNCTKLRYLALAENLIGGSLPDSVGNLSSSVSFLYLGSNKISGQIPPSIGRLTSLTLLNMSYNQLSGSIPPEIGHLKKLQVLELTRNKLSGPVPMEIGHLTALETLNIGQNELVGGVPEELGLLQHVDSLDISSNNLHGDIPASLFELRSLSSILNLSHNSLTAASIEIIGQLQNIIAIDLSDNLLNSSIPRSIGQCQRLQTLSLSRNAMSGVIPDSIGTLGALQSLDLSSNKLTGSIPGSLSKLHLQLLNLSMNDLSGLVPSTGIFENHSFVYLDGNPNLCYDSSLACYHSQYSSDRRKMHIVIVVAAASAAAISILGVIFVMHLSRRHFANARSRVAGSLIRRNHRLISYNELCHVTNTFDEANLIGVGSFGSVYKAMLHDGTPVAIKVLDLHKMGAPKTWVTECGTLRNVRHRNLIKLVTICASADFSGNDFRALVYELMSNGSLEDWIQRRRQHENGAGLNAEEVLNIAIDVASALEYMHNDCGEQVVVHCDIKPSNVLLDGDMNAKIGDFGLARLLAPTQPEQQSVSSIHGLTGSIGYIPPEYGYGSKP
ncbi:receptor kinase-like protein Xa21 [Miscanthus floridulus]|uniref:receptor kinase-like protein Xa21 n=1 Tax=Miscanthus floridulus TaxID=154761 RepID=UPI0034588B85